MVKLICAFVLAALLMPSSSAWDIHMDDAEMLARLLWGECRGVESTMEQAAVAWTVLNRVDDPRFPDTIAEVIVQPHQFTGYSKSNPVDTDLLDLAMDVIIRWQMERDGHEDVGRVLPKEYVYFVAGRGNHNNFSSEWPVGSDIWDWSLEDPYTDINGEEIIENDGTDGVVEMDQYIRADHEDRRYAGNFYPRRRRYDADVVD